MIPIILILLGPALLGGLLELLICKQHLRHRQRPPLWSALLSTLLPVLLLFFAIALSDEGLGVLTPDFWNWDLASPKGGMLYLLPALLLVGFPLGLIPT